MTGLQKNSGALHFVGIGGIGMSGIAEILDTLGYQVQGSDIAQGANVKRLQDKGIDIQIGHDTAHVSDEVMAVVISSAVKSDNPEVVAARAQKIPVIRRAEMLAELMRLKRAVAVAGTHGKTTTTAMVGEMLTGSELDPTVINGGIVNSLGTNVRLGESDIMVVEADESDGTFTRLPAEIAVVTNIDPEHLDHYGSFDNAKAAYRQFIENIPFYGFAVMCLDHPEVQAMIPSITDRKVVTYGFSLQAQVRAESIRQQGFAMVFDAYVHDEKIEGLVLPMLGQHNVQNALVAIAIAYELGVSADVIKSSLANFTGVKRRFTKTGEVNGVGIIDDYAHHPVEIETVLKTARSAVDDRGKENTRGKVIAVMQPHRYSRLEDLFEDFSTCFDDADIVVIADVYEAGEEPIQGVDKEHLVQSIRDHGHKDVQALEGPENLAGLVQSLAQSGDLVVCMGAGNITAWAHELPDQLKSLNVDAA